jgi:hypothetical protein
MGDCRPEPIDHRWVTGELGQHRDQHTGISLVQVGSQFMRIDTVRRRRRFGIGRHEPSIGALVGAGDATVY